MTDVIPLPPHRTKGPGTLGATPEQPYGPFGRWPGDDEEHDAAAPDTAVPSPHIGRER
ncbi:hypothetical protein [Streptomyces sp. NBRC 110465]|uniref:hypothetical protein n=1 Tax=Streptomyces sp. NBRC 110465 TaxID=1897621 RepID=UPI0015BAB58F|nr:hypothetical protein [Streptomyces sp. NBRC 110465]